MTSKIKYKFFEAGTSVDNLSGGVIMHNDGQCNTDTFSVTAPGNDAPPVICGTNTGEHSKLTKERLKIQPWTYACVRLLSRPQHAELRRVKKHASRVQNMFCLKYKIIGHRIGQLGSLAHSAKLPCWLFLWSLI